jgi:hypothetical protein
MIDLEAIKKHRALWEPDDCTSLPTICEHVDALVAEVERLRSINDDFLLEMGRQHALLRDQAREAKTERAAVVAWLNAEANEPHPIEAPEPALSPSGRGLLLRAADAIEHGEHRRDDGE